MAYFHSNLCYKIECSVSCPTQEERADLWFCSINFFYGDILAFSEQGAAISKIFDVKCLS